MFKLYIGLAIFSAAFGVKYSIYSIVPQNIVKAMESNVSLNKGNYIGTCEKLSDFFGKCLDNFFSENEALNKSFDGNDDNLKKFFKDKLKLTSSRINAIVLYNDTLKDISGVFGPIWEKLAKNKDGNKNAMEVFLEFCKKFYTVLMLRFNERAENNHLSLYQTEYNNMLSVLVKEPKDITTQEKTDIINIYKKTIVFINILKRFINWSRGHIVNENYFSENYFEDLKRADYVEKKVTCAFVYFCGLLRQLYKISMAIKYKFRYDEFEELSWGSSAIYEEELQILGNISDDVNNRFLKNLKGDTIDVDKFFNKKGWPDEESTGLEGSELISYEDIEKNIEKFDKLARFDDLEGWWKIRDYFDKKIENSYSEASVLQKDINKTKEPSELERKKNDLKFVEKGRRSVHAYWGWFGSIRNVIEKVSNMFRRDENGNFNALQIGKWVLVYNFNMFEILSKHPNNVSDEDCKKIKEFYFLTNTVMGKIKEYMFEMKRCLRNIKNKREEYTLAILTCCNDAEKCLNMWYIWLRRASIAMCGKFFNILKDCVEKEIKDTPSSYQNKLQKLSSLLDNIKSYNSEFPTIFYFNKNKRVPDAKSEIVPDVKDESVLYAESESFFDFKYKGIFDFEDKIMDDIKRLSELFERHSNNFFPVDRVRQSDLNEFFKKSINLTKKAEFDELYNTFKNINKMFGSILKKLGNISDVEELLEFCRKLYTALMLGKGSLSSLSLYQKEYNDMLSVLQQDPKDITPQEKSDIINIYKKTIVLGNIFKKCINCSRIYLDNKKRFEYFRVHEFEFINVLTCLDGLLMKFNKIGMAIKDKFKYSELEEFLGDVSARGEEELKILGKIPDNVNGLLKGLKIGNNRLFKSYELNEQNLKKLFDIGLVELERISIKLGSSEAKFPINIEQIYSCIKNCAKEWENKNGYYKIASICGWVKELSLLERNTGLLGIYKNSVADIGDLLKKMIGSSYILGDEEKKKLVSFYKETRELICILKDFSLSINCEFFLPEYERYIYDEMFNKIDRYVKCADCYINGWVNYLLDIEKLLLGRFPEFLSVDLTNSDDFDEFVEKFGLKNFLDELKAKESSAYILTKVSNLKECEKLIKVHIENCTGKMDHKKWHVKQSINAFDENLNMIESVFDKRDFKDDYNSRLAKEGFKNKVIDNFCNVIFRKNVEHGFYEFCKTKLNKNDVEFTLSTKEIEENIKKYYLRLNLNDTSGVARLSLNCFSKPILDFIKTTSAVMQYVMSDEFAKDFKYNIGEIFGFCSIENKFLKGLFESFGLLKLLESDYALDKVHDVLFPEVLNKINSVLEFYLSKLNKFLNNFTSYADHIGCFGFCNFNFDDSTYRRFCKSWLANARAIVFDERQDYINDVINDFTLLGYFCKNSPEKKQLITAAGDLLKKMQYNLTLWDRRLALYCKEEKPYYYVLVFKMLDVMRKAFDSVLSAGTYEKYLEVVNNYVNFMQSLCEKHKNMSVKGINSEVKTLNERVDKMVKFVLKPKDFKKAIHTPRNNIGGLFFALVMAHMGVMMCGKNEFGTLVDGSMFDFIQGMKIWNPKYLKHLK